MNHGHTQLRSSGFALIEAVLSVTLVTLFISTFALVAIYTQEQSASAIRGQHALLFAEEGLEAARAIRNDDFSLLADGSHGLLLTPSGWTFSGTEDGSGQYARTISISPIGVGRKMVASTVSWNERIDTLTISLSTVLTDWR